MYRALLVCCLVALGMIGCAPQNIALISTDADPAYGFFAGEAPVVVVTPMRGETFDPGFEPSLAEKVLVDEVSEGLRQAGFIVRGTQQDAQYTILCRAETIFEEYDSYQRVPVIDTSIGYVHTRRGTRVVHGVRHSSVIVPTRREYTFERLELVALKRDASDAAAQIGQDIDLLAIWSAVVTSNGPHVITDHVWQTHEAALLWGRTADARIDYDETRR